MRYLPNRLPARCAALALCALSTLTAVGAPLDARTQAVSDYLHAIWGKAVIAGQADLTWKDSVDMAERVHADTGKYPALMGYDFMNYDGSEADGQHQTEEAIAFSRKGGLVSFHWHWRMKGKFYAHEPDARKNTDFIIPMDKDSQGYRQINRDIDDIAVQLKRLQDAGVPVLWRPLHEASGGWFWWGRARSDGVAPSAAYIQLWRHMHDRLVNHHGLRNLIWVWNGQDPAWYPGDDVVDISGYDIYDKTDNKAYGSQAQTYRTLQRHGKPIALSETSYIPDPDKMAADGAWWLWFMVWNDGGGPPVTNENNFWSGEYYNTSAHKKKVYNHPNVITLERLPRF
jgi:mannan endo-1,4-beta-mannosidase